MDYGFIGLLFLISASGLLLWALRGHAQMPLATDVVTNACKAATADPRFPPLSAEELARVTTVLGAALSAFVGVWALNGLPQPYHPVFNVPAFERASRDRFFLCIEATDPQFDPQTTRAFLEGLHPVGVSDVEP